MAIQRYEFRVAGTLSERVQGAFDDMQVVVTPPETIIRGEIVDESHLHGVLALLRALGLHMVSINQVPSCRRLCDERLSIDVEGQGARRPRHVRIRAAAGHGELCGIHVRPRA